jgi:predicted Fe-Mo cluster-binding NifX family protein
MRIAISAMGPTLDAEVDTRFGRCQCFIIVDPETMEFEVVENSSAMAAGGAGIAAGQMIASKGVAAVLTGNFGPNAYQVLSAAGLQLISGVSGKVRDAVQAYKSGQFQATSQPTVDAHFGVGGTPDMGAGTGFGMGGGGMGRGKGMGRGMGRGMGMGMGRGMGRGMGIGGGTGAGMMPPVSPAAQPVSPEQELEVLKAQSQALAQQLAEIQHRIEELEKEKR